MVCQYVNILKTGVWPRSVWMAVWGALLQIEGRYRSRSAGDGHHALTDGSYRFNQTLTLCRETKEYAQPKVNFSRGPD